MLQGLALQALAEINPGSPQEDRFVVISAAISVVQCGDLAEPRLQVTVNSVFPMPFSEVNNQYPQLDEITLQSLLEKRQKWRALGHDCIATFLEVLALKVVQIVPMIV